MMHKKLYAAVGAALACTSVFAMTVFAEDSHMEKRMDERKETKGSMMKPLENMLKKLEQIDTKEFSFSTEHPEKDTPSTMTLNPHGEIRLTNGKVTAVSGDIITVEVWKLSFSVHNMPDTKVLAGSKREITFAQIAVGDMVGVLGQLDIDKVAFIHAQIIHDRTQVNRANTDQERSRIQSLINDLIKRLNALGGRGQSPLVSPSGSPLPSSSPSPSTTPAPSPSVSASPSASPSPSSTPGT